MTVNFPTNVQELFDLAIKNSVAVNYEFKSGRKEGLELYAWAIKFAENHKLNPPDMEKCGIYYPVEIEEVEELNLPMELFIENPLLKAPVVTPEAMDLYKALKDSLENSNRKK